jgi:hypothetical protein
MRVRRPPIGLLACSILAGGAIAGVALRAWVLSTPAIGYFDSDEAIPALMARHFLHGQISTFYWGQHYGGALEVGLVAIAFLVGGANVISLSVVPILLSAVAAILVWRIGLRTIGARRAAVAAALAWVWPGYFVWRSTREYGYYGVLLVCALTIVLLALRLRDEPNGMDAAALGAAVGIGWWSSLQISLVAVPAVAWLVWRRPAVLRYLPLALGIAVGAASPWLVDNVRSGWASLAVNPAPALRHTYGYRLAHFFTDGLPMTLGVRTPWLLHWLPTAFLGKLLFGAAVAWIVVTLARRHRSLELLATVIVTLPFLYAVSGFTYNRIEPRYLGLLAPLLALIVAAMLDLRVAALVVAAASTLSVVALVQLRNGGGIAPGAPDVRAPTTVGPLIRTLDRHRITRATADYWVAYRVTFLSRERIVVVPIDSDPYPPYDLLVTQSDRVAVIFVRGTATETTDGAQLLTGGYRRDRAGPYDVYLPP